MNLRFQEETSTDTSQVASVVMHPTVPLTLSRVRTVIELRDKLAQYAIDAASKLGHQDSSNFIADYDHDPISKIAWIAARKKVSEVTIKGIILEEGQEAIIPYVHLRIVKHGNKFGIEVTPIDEPSGFGERLAEHLTQKFLPFENKINEPLNQEDENILSKIDFSRLKIPVAIIAGLTLGIGAVGGIGSGTYRFLHEQEISRELDREKQNTARQQSAQQDLDAFVAALQIADRTQSANLLTGQHGYLYEKLEAMLNSEDATDREQALNYIPILFTANKSANREFTINTATGELTTEEDAQAQVTGAKAYFQGLVLRHYAREPESKLKDLTLQVSKKIDSSYQEILRRWTSFNEDEGKRMAAAVGLAAENGNSDVVHKIIFGHGNYDLYRYVEDTLINGTENNKLEILPAVKAMISDDLKTSSLISIHPDLLLRTNADIPVGAELKEISTLDYWSGLVQRAAAKAESSKLQRELIKLQEILN